MRSNTWNDSFFFQAEDGIRDHCVTGVQTCALPIYFEEISTSLMKILVFVQQHLYDTQNLDADLEIFLEIGRASCRERV